MATPTTPVDAQSGQRIGPWRRPDMLRLELSTELHSGPNSTMEAYGWQSWQGLVVAIWHLWEAGSEQGVPHSEERGWEEAVPRFEEEQVELPVGRILAHALRFGEQPRSPGAEAVGDAATIFEAADAVSQTLAETVTPLLDLDDSLTLFTGDVLDAIGEDAFIDELLVMDETELDPRVRGSGLGAWADARLITLLAPSEFTLVVAKAAPLRRSDFIEGEDSGRPLTPHESAAWQAAQDRLWSYWERTLGLARLESNRGLLVGLGGVSEAREGTLARWLPT